MAGSSVTGASSGTPDPAEAGKTLVGMGNGAVTSGFGAAEPAGEDVGDVCPDPTLELGVHALVRAVKIRRVAMRIRVCKGKRSVLFRRSAT